MVLTSYLLPFTPGRVSRLTIYHSLFTFLLLAAGEVNAQHNFNTITEKNGLSDNRVTCFLHDRDGFMWIGTANGLNRFDGHAFTVYRPGPGGICNEHVNALRQDSTGTIWIATWQGLSVMAPTGNIRSFIRETEANEQIATEIPSNLIWDICIDDMQDIWLAADARDLTLLDPETGTFKYFPWREFVRQQFPGRPPANYTSIHKILPGANNTLWLGTTVGLFSFDRATGAFTYVGGDKQSDFLAIHYDEVSNRLYFTQQNVYVYDLSTRELKLLSPVASTNASQHDIDLVLPARDQFISIDRKNSVLKPFQLRTDDDFALHIDFAKATFRDRNGMLWIGTTSGIRQYDPNMNRFPWIEIPSHAKPSSYYHILERDKGNGYYVSNILGNEWLVLDKDGRITRFTSAAGRPLYKPSLTYQDSKGRIWVLSYSAIYHYNPSRKEFTSVSFPFAHQDVSLIEMTEDADGNFWFVSLHKGLFRLSNRGEWRHFDREDQYFGYRATAVCADNENRAVWIGDYGFGLYRYDLQTGRFFHYPVRSIDPSSLQSSLVTDILLDSSNNIWVATSGGGLSKIHRKHDTDSIRTYSVATGLNENTMQSIQVDGHGHIWASSFRGLEVIDGSGHSLQFYDAANGLSFNNLSTPMSRNADGSLMIGVEGGFLRFHPDSLKPKGNRFPVVLTEMFIRDSAIHATLSHTFRYSQNELSFRFAALTYSMNDKVKYWCRLDGYDQEWKSIDLTEAKYTNLEPGTYTFRIRAESAAGVESLNVASATFTIEPPFWKTWWFRGGTTITVASFLAWWILGLRRKERSQRLLKQVATTLYSQKTTEQVFETIAQQAQRILQLDQCEVIAVGSPGSNREKFAQVISSQRATSHHDGKGTVWWVPLIVHDTVVAVIVAQKGGRYTQVRWLQSMLTEIAEIAKARIGRYFVEEQIRSKVARDLHDDMGSALSSINIMSRVALEKDDPAAANKYLRVIRENTAQIQESMSDMVWALNPDNDSMEKLVQRMREFSAEILEPTGVTYHFEQGEGLNSVALDLHARRDFYLIFKEALNNAAKYSRATLIRVLVQADDRELVLLVDDDGKGFDPEVSRSGNGLKNMRHRAQTLGAELTVRSGPGRGTVIRLSLKR